MRAIQISQHGGSEVLDLAELPEPTAGDGEVVIRSEFAGVNFIDTYQREGLYPVPLPFTPGMETAGTISEVGPGVTNFSIGDRVAVTHGPGGYAEFRAAAEAHLLRVPDNLASDIACASVLQGMTAHYLSHDTFPLAEGDTCLIHAGAGGTGRLLIQMAKKLGATVFTTVGSAPKAELAASAGADHVIRYDEADFAEAIRDLAGSDRPVDVVYDGVGASVFDQSLSVIRPRGLMATFGNASGTVPPVPPLTLTQAGSLFLTRPALFDYIATPEDLQRRSNDLFSWAASGELDVRVGETHDLADVATAHDRLEGRQTTGKILLTM